VEPGALYFWGRRPELVRISILLPEKSRVRSLAVSPDGRQIAMVLVKDGKQQIWVRALDAAEPAALAGTDGANDPFWSPDSRFIGFFADAKLKKIHRSGGPVQILCDALAARGGTWSSSGNPSWLAAASRQAVLAYVSGPRTGQQYVWRDRQGRYLGSAGTAGEQVCISPDGKHLVGDFSSTTRVLDLGTGVATDLMAVRTGNSNPIWSPDGKYVAISWGKLGWGVYRKPSTGAGEWEPLTLADHLTAPKSWSPDGRFILYAQIHLGTGADLMAVPAQPNATPFPVAQTPANEDQGQFSPDGHWVAYTSNESGLSEIYVIPFPPSADGGRWRASSGGGVMPRWRRDGKELFYISPDSQMMAVDVTTTSVFKSGNPHPLFQTDIVDTGIRTGPMSWDIAPDSRFLIISETSTDAAITVVLNWRSQSN
jgi:Tol biopolymer transport system component